MFQKMHIGKRIKLAFLAVGLLPLLLIGWIASHTANDALTRQTFQQLASLREVKKERIEDFFGELNKDLLIFREDLAVLQRCAENKLTAAQSTRLSLLDLYFTRAGTDARFFSESPTVVSAMTQYSTLVTPGRPVDEEVYTFFENLNFSALKTFADIYDYKDLLLINQQGDIVYTMNRGTDLGKNITDAAFEKSTLPETFRQGLSGVSIGDFAPYSPDNGAPALFIAAPVQEFGEPLGALVLKIGRKQINAVVQEAAGMGETSETYLVGMTEAGPEYRSDRVVKAGKIGASKTGPDVERLFAGESGLMVKVGSTGSIELSRFDPVPVAGLEWGMITTVSLEEILTPRSEDGMTDFFSQYIDTYEFYDLFLIHPDGQIFYTVKRESDFNANVFEAPIAGSGLGQLVEKVLDTRSFAFEDFAPYEPSGGIPGAFVGLPFMKDDALQMVIAMQITPRPLNRVMSQRTGMGRTGETFLVGPDFRMRSSARHDAQKYSVAASVSLGGATLETAPVKAALSGETGQGIFTSYGDRKVIAAYAPLENWGIRYALVSEMAADEALAPARRQQFLIGLVVGGAALLILLSALGLTRTIVGPVRKVILGLKQSADHLAGSAREVHSAGQTLSSGATEQAASLEETAASLTELVRQVQENADGTEKARGLILQERETIAQADSVMTSLTETMEKIAASSEETFGIVSTIEEISFQTNLLALNAAVEAARAGEAGAGFSVVAGEVRRLALRASEAAKETASLIESTVARVRSGDDLVTASKESFDRISGRSEETEALIRKIADASQEQARGIGQIHQVVADMDQVTQQNAANAETAAATAEALKEQAQRLSGFVADLLDLVGQKGERNPNRT